MLQAMTEEEAQARVFELFSNRCDRLEKDSDSSRATVVQLEREIQDLKLTNVKTDGRLAVLEKDFEPVKTEVDDLSKWKVKMLAYASVAMVVIPLIYQWLMSPKPSP